MATQPTPTIEVIKNLQRAGVPLGYRESGACVSCGCHDFLFDEEGLCVTCIDQFMRDANGGDPPAMNITVQDTTKDTGRIR